MIREDDANGTSGEFGFAFGGTLVGVSQLRLPLSEPLIESAIPVSTEDVILKIDAHCCKSWLDECRCWK